MLDEFINYIIEQLRYELENLEAYDECPIIEILVKNKIKELTDKVCTIDNTKEWVKDQI